jgi:hypothetical protein
VKQAFLLSAVVLVLSSYAPAGDVLINEHFDALLGATHTPYTLPTDSNRVGSQNGGWWDRGPILTTNDPTFVWFPNENICSDEILPYDTVTAYQYTGSPFYNRDIHASNWYGYNGAWHFDRYDLGEYRGADNSNAYNYTNSSTWQPLAVTPHWAKPAIFNVGINSTNFANYPNNPPTVSGTNHLVGGPDGGMYFRYGGTASYPYHTPLDDRDANGSNRALGSYMTSGQTQANTVNYIATQNYANNLGRGTVHAWKLTYTSFIWANAGWTQNSSEPITVTLNGVGDLSTWYSIGMSSTSTGVDAAACVNKDQYGQLITPTAFRNNIGLFVLKDGVDANAAVNLKFDFNTRTTVFTSDGRSQPYSPQNKNVGIAIDDVKLVAIWDGDANGDGYVNVIDLGIVASNYGKTGLMVANDPNSPIPAADGASWARGDFNQDGRVDPIDLGLLATNYRYGPSSDIGGTLPEPAGLTLMGIGIAAMVRRKTK